MGLNFRKSQMKLKAPNKSKPTANRASSLWLAARLAAAQRRIKSTGNLRFFHLAKEGGLVNAQGPGRLFPVAPGAWGHALICGFVANCGSNLPGVKKERCVEKRGIDPRGLKALGGLFGKGVGEVGIGKTVIGGNGGPQEGLEVVVTGAQRRKP